MATASQIIRRALRILTVIDSQEALDANDAQDALETLNAILAELHEAQVGLPDYSLSSITDTLASDAADREALAYELALRLAPEYGRALSPEAAAAGQAAMGRMRLRYFQPGSVDFGELPAETPTFNITTGE